MGMSLLYFFKKLPHEQFNFRFYLLLPFLIEARVHSVNDEKWQKTTGTARGENFLWLWSKIRWRLNSCSKVARSCISMHRSWIWNRRGGDDRRTEKHGSTRGRGISVREALMQALALSVTLSRPLRDDQDTAHFHQTWGYRCRVGRGELGHPWRMADMSEPVKDLGLLCCLPGDWAYLGNPSWSLRTPEAVLAVESSEFSQCSLATWRDWCLSLLRAAPYHLSSVRNIWNSKVGWGEPTQCLRGQCLVRYNKP